jgi:hypothetical protein
MKDAPSCYRRSNNVPMEPLSLTVTPFTVKLAGHHINIPSAPVGSRYTRTSVLNVPSSSSITKGMFSVLPSFFGSSRGRLWTLEDLLSNLRYRSDLHYPPEFHPISLLNMRRRNILFSNLVHKSSNL